MKKKSAMIAILSIIILLIQAMTINAQAVEINLEIETPAAILIESKTGRVLYEKNANQKMFPASTTKLMTALLVIENVANIEDKTTISYQAIHDVPAGYSTDLLKVGEEMSIKDLLYALLVKSSNEAANVLAEHVGGSIESFVSMMNTRAIELGCTNTNFQNPIGVHNENHYSTAYDLSLIAREAMKNETIREMVATASYTLPKTNIYDRVDRTIITTNDLIRKSSKYYYEYAIGIKTGFTSQAKNCLVAGAKKDDLELIAVLLGAEKYNSNRESTRDVDAKNLFEYVFNNFSEKEILKKDEVVKQIEIKNATKETKNLDLVAANQIETLVTNDQVNKKDSAEITLNGDLKAPIKKGDVVGKVRYEIDGIEYTSDLIAGKDVEKSYAFIIMIVILIYLLIIAFMLQKKQKRKKRKGKRKNYKTYGRN